jgi:hypothetical protein
MLRLIAHFAQTFTSGECFFKKRRLIDHQERSASHLVYFGPRTITPFARF